MGDPAEPDGPADRFVAAHYPDAPREVRGFLKAKSAVSASSVDTYGWILKSYVRWRGSARVDRDSYDEYVGHLRGAGRRPNGIHTAAVAVRDYAGHRGRDVSGWQLPRREDLAIDGVRPNEMALLLAACDRPGNFSDPAALRAFVHTLAGTGLRIQEFMRLRWTDVDLPGHFLVVRGGKGGRSRRVPIDDRNVARDLRAYRESRWGPMSDERARLVADRISPFEDRKTAERWLGALAERAGLSARGVHPHLLRHTFAQSYLNQGGDIVELQKILGHSSLATTQKYLRYSTPRPWHGPRPFSVTRPD